MNQDQRLNFDFATLPASDRYRLLTSFVAPRPVALVSTLSEGGQSNAAPMSFFNVFAQEPPLLILGVQARSDGSEKDTVINIRRTKEFVINMVDGQIAEQMVICGANVPPDMDEVQLSGLTAVPSAKVAAPTILQSPCSMECRVERIIDFPSRALILGIVVQMKVRRSCLDDDGRYIRPGGYEPIARLHADNYILSDRQFVLQKPASFAAVEAEFLGGLAQ
ncbi:flavin reductase family protein [Roseovarius aestuarii]|nr:flavin reductase family protein [Roseovarius aestuarii]